MSQFMFGADPEFFLYDTKKEHFVSAYGLFPGTKDNPHPLDQGAVQVDGLALEFNIDATSDPQEFHDRIDHVLGQIYVMMKDVSSSLTAKFIPFAEFPKKYFEDLPEDCKILGCDPDFNQDGVPNPAPTELINRPWRTAAGHVHIGWDKNLDVNDPAHRADCSYVSKHMGQIDGDFSDSNYQRQRYYGRTGAHRPKTYGVELRCPSNKWVIGKKDGRKSNNPYGLITSVSRKMAALG